MSEKVKLGRPPNGERRKRMRTITFAVTDDVVAALRELEDALGPPVRGRTSVVLRNLILNARRKL